MNCVVLIAFKLSKSTGVAFFFYSAAEYSKCTCEQSFTHRRRKMFFDLSQSDLQLLARYKRYNIQDTRYKKQTICGKILRQAKRDECDEAMKKIKKVAFFFLQLQLSKKKSTEQITNTLVPSKCLSRYWQTTTDEKRLSFQISISLNLYWQTPSTNLPDS